MYYIHTYICKYIYIYTHTHALAEEAAKAVELLLAAAAAQLQLLHLLLQQSNLAHPVLLSSRMPSIRIQN